MHKNGFCCTRVENLTVVLGKKTLLRDVSFHLHCGEMTVVIGRNGAGKTSLLRALLGELRYTGKVSFHSYEGLAHRPDGATRHLHIGYVPQRASVDPGAPVSVYDLCAALRSRPPVFIFHDKALRTRIQQHLETFGAGGLIDQRLASLSGGEWQRVMLAMATDPAPELLLLDEPASGVDRNGMLMLYEKLHELKRAHDMSILMVSHDFGLLTRYADRVLLLEQGAVLAQGKPDELMGSEAFRSVFEPFSFQ